MVKYQFATEEQKELAMLARGILEKNLVPKLDELEKSGEFPMDVKKALDDAGFCCPAVPEDWGGLGLGLVDRCLIYEEMAKISAGFTFAYHGDCSEYIRLSNIPEADKKAWMERIMGGDSMAAFGLTEPEAGSDALNIKTTAVRDGDEWVLNGTKCFCSQASLGNYGIFIAYTNKELGAKGMSAFFVEKERGWKVTKIEKKIGMHLSPTCEVVLDNVRVPADHIVGKEGEGLRLAMMTINEARINTLSMGLGLADAALDYAVKYAKERRQKGRRIIDHQGLGFLIADMKTKVDAARAFLYYAARCYDEGLDMGTLSSEVKVFVSDVAMEVTTNAVQVLGGYSLCEDYPVERYMRDAKVFQIFEGANQIQLDTIAKALAGRDPQKKK